MDLYGRDPNRRRLHRRDLRHDGYHLVPSLRVQLGRNRLSHELPTEQRLLDRTVQRLPCGSSAMPCTPWD
jgi:hypothetical protein